MGQETRLSFLLRVVLIATVFLLVGSAAGAQITGATDVNLSQKTGDDNECAISKNPANPNQLFAFCNNGGPGLVAVRSTDGGLTWVYPDPADKTIADGDAGQGAAACCDPTSAWDTFGNLYITYINASVTAIVTLLSTDGGATFSNLASFAGSVDQPTVVAANTSAPGAPVAVWIVWNQSNQMVARGAAVTGLGAVGAFGALQTSPGTVGCSFGDVAIAPTGAVVQACQNPIGGQGPATIFVNTDADGLGPGNFGPAVAATTTNVGGFDFIPAQNTRSVDSEAGLAFDNNPASPHFGRLYLVYTEETVDENNDMDVLLRFSDNNGGTWSAPIRVNDDPAAPIRSQFLPKIAVDDTSGNISICWHDARNSAANTAMQVFCTVAPSTGPTPIFLANVRISDGASTSNGSGIEFGDYSGLDYFSGVSHPIWADTSNTTGNNPNGTANFDAVTDRVTGGMAAPQIQVPANVSFPTTCGGTAQATANICNTGKADLIVTGITSSNAQFSVAPPSSGYPVTIAAGACLPIQISFSPSASGLQTGTLTVSSNDSAHPTVNIAVSGIAGRPTIATVIADTGNFGEVCPKPHALRDLPLTINNSGTCPLTITGLASSSSEFELPQVLSFPLSVAPGDSIEIPLRFHPASPGAKSATVTISSNDPTTPSKSVAVSGSAPPDYVCEPPTFAAIGASLGPTFGTGATGSYTVNGSGHFLGSFGSNRTFAIQAQGEYMFYSGRQEGQIDSALLYRNGIWQIGFGGSFKPVNLRTESFPGTLSEATFSLDWLLPTVRFGIFGSKGLKETDVVGLSETIGAPAPGGQPVIAKEHVAHTVDSLGGMVQFGIVPGTWIDANAAFLNRHAPGASNTAGAAVRVSKQLLPWLVGTAQLDVNESFVGANAVGTVTFGVTIGRWPQPKDYANPINPLGSLVPRVHYEVFDRIR